MESFFGTPQRELLDRRSWATRAELASAIFEWIEGWHDPRRRHTSIGDLGLVDHECPYAAAEAAAWLPHLNSPGKRVRIRSGYASSQALRAGETHILTPADAECSKHTRVDDEPADPGGPFPQVPPPNQGIVVHECIGGHGRIGLDSGSASLDKVDIGASVTWSLGFELEQSDSTSVVPVRIQIPLRWDGTLFNSSLLPLFEDARADVGATLRVRSDGVTLAENHFQSVVHSGPECLRLPRGVGTAVKMAVDCLVQLFEFDEGEDRVEFNLLLETGKRYEIDLRLEANVFTVNASGFIPLSGLPLGGSVGVTGKLLELGNSFELVWESMIVTIGTDYAQAIDANLRAVEELRSEIRGIRDDLDRVIDALPELHRPGIDLGDPPGSPRGNPGGSEIEPEPPGSAVDRLRRRLAAAESTGANEGPQDTGRPALTETERAGSVPAER